MLPSLANILASVIYSTKNAPLWCGRCGKSIGLKATGELCGIEMFVAFSDRIVNDIRHPAMLAGLSCWSPSATKLEGGSGEQAE